MADILVVDDDALISAMLSEDLVELGHHPILVDSALAALRVLADGEPIDLVVTDVLMPDMDGIELIQALRRDDPTLPIIAISSGGMFEAAAILKVARILGADRVMHKPVQAKSLGEAIGTLLEARRIEAVGYETPWPAAGNSIVFERQAIMGNVISFGGNKNSILHSNDSNESADVGLHQADDIGNHIVDKLAEYDAWLDWTLKFCRDCIAATELSDLPEMIRQRDELSDMWTRRVAAKA